MAVQLQLRRGTEAENAAFVGAQGEMTYSTDTKSLRIHDGETVGGFPVDVVVAWQKPTAENNYTWYRKYASGWVEQGGGLSGNFPLVSLPVKMADTNYIILTQWSGGKSSSFYAADMRLYNITTTGFNTNGPTNSNVTQRNWYVCGQAALNEPGKAPNDPTETQPPTDIDLPLPIVPDLDDGDVEL